MIFFISVILQTFYRCFAYRTAESTVYKIVDRYEHDDNETETNQTQTATYNNSRMIMSVIPK